MPNYTAAAATIIEAQGLPQAALSDAITLLVSVTTGLITLEALQALSTLPQPALRAAIGALAVQLDARAATQQGEAQALTQALDVALEDGTL